MEIEITYRGVKLLVEGTYIPPEEETRYYEDMTGFPGAPSEFDINAVFVQDTDIYALLGNDELEHISELTTQEIEK